jgi:2-polyprenyl-6-methoxyphenol hydroxylase-like FAD-dependent oxidoreductase
LLITRDRVVGLRGHGKSGTAVEEQARVIIGADGVSSLVARMVQAPEYDVRPVAACCYYSYFSGLEQDDIELYVREHCAFGGAPTNDGLHLVMVNWPARDFPEVRADIEGHVWRALATAPDFLARVREASREDTWYGTAGVPGYFRKPYGKGWALVGDASYNRDPITAQGITDAFIDAEMLAEALDRSLSGNGTFEKLMEAHETTRNERVRPMYEFTSQLAALEPPPPRMQTLFGALRHNQDATNAFLSAITGAIPLPEFMSDENLGRILAAAKAVEFPA